MRAEGASQLGLTADQWRAQMLVMGMMRYSLVQIPNLVKWFDNQSGSAGNNQNNNQNRPTPDTGSETNPGSTQGQSGKPNQPGNNKNQGNQTASPTQKETVTSNKGTDVDITRSTHHTTSTINLGIKGPPNSSVDILDSQGNIATRRWFDSNGRVFRDVDFTNHGNPGTHPECPHEHIWRFDADGNVIDRR